MSSCNLEEKRVYIPISDGDSVTSIPAPARGLTQGLAQDESITPHPAQAAKPDSTVLCRW